MDMSAIADLNRELVNRYPEAVASNYDEFMDRIFRIIQVTLNSTDEGIAFMDPFVANRIRNNLTDEEWQLKKVDIMKVIFFMFIDAFPLLKEELAHHLYRKLRKES